MEKEIKEINIEEIMNEIRKNINERGYSDDIPSFKDISFEIRETEKVQFDEKLFDSYLAQVQANCEIQYYEPIKDGSVKKFIKKVVRKLMSFQLVPMTVQQNTFNSFVLGSLRNVQDYIRSNDRTEINVMSQQQEESYFDYHEKPVEHLETKILLLEQKIEQLENELKGNNK